MYYFLYIIDKNWLQKRLEVFAHEQLNFYIPYKIFKQMLIIGQKQKNTFSKTLTEKQ